MTNIYSLDYCDTSIYLKITNEFWQKITSSELFDFNYYMKIMNRRIEWIVNMEIKHIVNVNCLEYSNSFHYQVPIPLIR